MGNIRIDLSYSSVNTRTKFELNFVLSKLLQPTAKEIIQVKINKHFQSKIVNIFLPIFLAYVLGARKNRLIETVLLRTNSICFC